MRFQKLVINAGVEGFVNWILNRLGYKPVLIPINSNIYVVDAKYVKSHYPYLLFVAKDRDKDDVDLRDLVQFNDVNSENADTSTETKIANEELKKGNEVQEIIDKDKLNEPDLAGEEFKGNNEIWKIIENEFFLQDINLLQIFLISLDSSKTEAYCVIYDEVIEEDLKTLIDEIDSLWGLIKNEPIGITSWYQNYAFFPMFPIEQKGLTDEELISQLFPKKEELEKDFSRNRSIENQEFIYEVNENPSVDSNIKTLEKSSRRGSKLKYSEEDQLKMVSGWDELGLKDNRITLVDYLLDFGGPIHENYPNTPSIPPSTFYSYRTRLIKKKIYKPPQK